MKVGTIINVYNEIEWIETCIKSVIDHVDELVITEGAYGMAMNVGAAPRSTDGTLDVLEKYKSKSNVTVLHENEFEQCFQLNKGLEVLKNKKVDWLLMVDADEIWEPTAIKIIKNYMKMGQENGIYQYWANLYNFVNSFDQYIDSRLKRVFRITPGCHFSNRNEHMSWPDHGVPIGSGISTLPKSCYGYHYTEIKNGKRWLLKKEYLINRDHNPRFNKWNLTKDGVDHDEMHLVKKFTGKHPKIVQETELYKLWEKDKELLKKELFDVKS